MIILGEIQLNNFLSHKKTVLKAKGNEKLLIDGISGSGKSSIVEALIWGLYGKGRSDNRSLIKKGTKKATVTIILKDLEKKVSYKIERSINSSNKHDLAVRETKKEGEKYSLVKATGIKGSQEYLEQKVLKSSYILFINSIVYPQDNVESFVKQSASKRKDIILEIINAAGYDEYLKRVKKEIQQGKTDFEVLVSNIANKIELIEQDNTVVKQLVGYEEIDKKLREHKTVFESQENELREKQKRTLKQKVNLIALMARCQRS